jgi:phosphoribosylformimino-5-aminoimidazole carboxamide ribonucleotide (ProFAR) isomerase
MKLGIESIEIIKTNKETGKEEIIYHHYDKEGNCDDCYQKIIKEGEINE